MPLSAGDIAFIAWNGDGNDDFAIVLLADISSGQKIFFTDNEWDGVSGFNTGEGVLEWTATTNLSQGDVIVFSDVDNGLNPGFGASSGTLALADGLFGLNASADAVFAYTTSNGLFNGPPTPLAAIGNTTIALGDLTNSGLTPGDTAVNLETVTLAASLDGAVYSGDRVTGQTPAQMRAELANSANWTTNQSDGEAIIPIDGTAINITCFAVGSLIATPDGERCVETLRIGDTITTQTGRVVPVIWVGRQTVSKTFSGLRMQPVRFRAGSLGNGLPHSDLTVTADHGMILDGLVINASAMVNGSTIDWVPLSELPDRVTYYHVETEDHDVILANGAAAETFVDAVSRAGFDNHQEYLDLYRTERLIPEMGRPRITAQRLLPEPVRARLGIESAVISFDSAICA